MNLTIPPSATNDYPDSVEITRRGFNQIVERVHYGWWLKYNTKTASDLVQLETLVNNFSSYLVSGLYNYRINTGLVPFYSIIDEFIDEIDYDV